MNTKMWLKKYANGELTDKPTGGDAESALIDRLLEMVNTSASMNILQMDRLSGILANPGENLTQEQFLLFTITLATWLNTCKEDGS